MRMQYEHSKNHALSGMVLCRILVTGLTIARTAPSLWHRYMNVLTVWKSFPTLDSLMILVPFMFAYLMVAISNQHFSETS